MVSTEYLYFADIDYKYTISLNNHMHTIRKVLGLLEDEQIKSQVIDLVKTTDDTELLDKVLNTLTAGNIDKRIASVINQNPDGKQFLNQIAQVIIGIDAPIEVKDNFLSKLNDGIVDPAMLLDQQQHSFMELCGNDAFATEVFTELCSKLTSQGVGPGEVALAVFSPDIKWSGRAVGGGDIQVGKKAVEVKTSIVAGGRWINPRKAKMDMAGIEKAIQDGIVTVRQKHAKDKNADNSPMAIPPRLSPEIWVDKIRPILATEPSVLSKVAKVMADGVFNQTDNSEYRNAIINGDTAAIRQAYLKVGFENYKAYSHFDGILMMDVPTGSSEYFPDFDSMAGKIKPSSIYMYAPEGEAMPQVKLLATGSKNQFDYPEDNTDAAPSAPSKVKAPDEVAASTYGVAGLRPPGAGSSGQPKREISAPRKARA